MGVLSQKCVKNYPTEDDPEGLELWGNIRLISTRIVKRSPLASSHLKLLAMRTKKRKKNSLFSAMRTGIISCTTTPTGGSMWTVSPFLSLLTINTSKLCTNTINTSKLYANTSNTLINICSNALNTLILYFNTINTLTQYINTINTI